MNLNGKTIDFLGDSITEGVGVEDLNNRYDNRLKAMLNLKAVHNYGIGGTRIAHQITPSAEPRYDLCFCGRAYDLNREADVIVVYGGVNDWIHGDAPFGEMSDTTPASFCGAVDFLMNLLKEKYPNARLVFMTPAHACFDTLSDKQVSDRPMKRADAKPLAEYIRVIEERGEKHNIPVLNLYEKLGIDPNNSDEREKFTAEGLHFNDNGHAVLAERLAEFLKAL